MRVDVKSYAVQARAGGGDGEYIGIVEVPSSDTKVSIFDLLPGNSYDLRVVAVNDAGSTPSDPTSVSLPASGRSRGAWAATTLGTVYCSPPDSSQAPLPQHHTRGQLLSPDPVAAAVQWGPSHHPLHHRHRAAGTASKAAAEPLLPH